ncbi:MAG: PadR family transcriptional regulator [Caldilineales bacterium]|nr:PadR family transcriptional regulator [Caldilineales bacterium]MDW8318181.1 PadR family transcriptional regulator [Anaerolineae bacterium]
MSIKHALLALLAEGPSHGYELKRRFDEAMGHLWPLQQAQVYNNLRLLEEAGLVALEARVAQANLPDQKRYRLTEAGAQELAAWLAEPVQITRKIKDDFYLKLNVLASVLRRPDKLAELLWQQRAVTLQYLRELEAALAEAESRGDAVGASLLEGAILHAEADLAWLDRCEERLLGARGALTRGRP